MISTHSNWANFIADLQPKWHYKSTMCTENQQGCTPFLRSPGAGIDDDMVERGEDIAKGKVRKRKEKKAGKIKNNK